MHGPNRNRVPAEQNHRRLTALHCRVTPVELEESVGRVWKKKRKSYFFGG